MEMHQESYSRILRKPHITPQMAYYANGDVYDGEWKSSKRHGKGKMTYKESGGMYEEWREDKREGQDKMTYKDNKFNKCAYYEDSKKILNSC